MDICFLLWGLSLQGCTKHAQAKPHIEKTMSDSCGSDPLASFSCEEMLVQESEEATPLEASEGEEEAASENATTVDQVEAVVEKWNIATEERMTEAFDKLGVNGPYTMGLTVLRAWCDYFGSPPMTREEITGVLRAIKEQWSYLTAVKRRWLDMQNDYIERVRRNNISFQDKCKYFGRAHEIKQLDPKTTKFPELEYATMTNQKLRVTVPMAVQMARFFHQNTELFTQYLPANTLQGFQVQGTKFYLLFQDLPHEDVDEKGEPCLRPREASRLFCLSEFIMWTIQLRLHGGGISDLHGDLKRGEIEKPVVDENEPEEKQNQKAAAFYAQGNFQEEELEYLHPAVLAISNFCYLAFAMNTPSKIMAKDVGKQESWREIPHYKTDSDKEYVPPQEKEFQPPKATPSTFSKKKKKHHSGPSSGAHTSDDVGPSHISKVCKSLLSTLTFFFSFLFFKFLVDMFDLLFSIALIAGAMENVLAKLHMWFILEEKNDNLFMWFVKDEAWGWAVALVFCFKIVPMTCDFLVSKK
jgi:hypothetical protein